MAKPIEVPDIEARAVVDSRGFVVLYDLWVGGDWVGSRRTERACEFYLSSLCGVPIHATAGTPW